MRASKVVADEEVAADVDLPGEEADHGKQYCINEILAVWALHG